MRHLIILAAIPLAACGGSASGNGHDTREISGPATTRSFQITDFTGVDLRGSDNVEVKVGPAFAISAEGPKELLDKLEIEKRGSTLRIGRVKDAEGFSWGGNHDGKGVVIHVTMPAIVAANIAGSGDMTIDKVAGGDLKASVAGSGDLTIDGVASNSADLSIAGSGDMKLKGQTGQTKISVVGSGNVEGEELKATSANVSVAGSGNVRVDVVGPADVSVVGSGDVDLGKGAKCSTTKMGSGDVTCGS